MMVSVTLTIMQSTAMTSETSASQTYSLYSRPWVKPKAKPSGPLRTVRFQKRKVTQPRGSDQRRVFSRAGT